MSKSPRLQSLVPAEEELKSKVKVHEEYVELSAQFEKATARLQFWEALKTNTLPAHLATLHALSESKAIERAEAYLKFHIAQRALPLGRRRVATEPRRELEAPRAVALHHRARRDARERAV